jgi:hypothetical protein
MAVTGLRGRQILDGSIVRGDLNTTVTGDAVIRRIIQGTGLSISSTGVDTGTGDVTLNLATSGVGAGGTFGSGSLVPVITVDTYGRITSITTAAVSGSASSLPLSSITAATATNDIDNVNFGQTWRWNSLTGTAFTISSNSTTAGTNTLLNIQRSGSVGTNDVNSTGLNVRVDHTGGANASATAGKFYARSVAGGAAEFVYGISTTALSNGAAPVYGIYSEAQAASGTSTLYSGYFYTIGGSGTADVYGVYSLVGGSGTGGDTYGARFDAAEGSSTGIVYGIYVTAQGTVATRYSIYTDLGNVRIGTLTGTGTRMVVADSNGILSTQALPGGSGTVTSVSVVTANGFAGTVATNTTTPAITISTTVTGLLKGNGTTISAAVASTDYVVPSDLNAYVPTSRTLTINGTTFDLSADRSWTISSSGGYTIVSVTTTHNETATSGTKIVKADTTGGGFTINLPTAVSNTATIVIKKTDGTADLTVDANGSETIDGGATAILRRVDESITLISDNSNWLII